MAPALRYDDGEFKIHCLNKNVDAFVDNYFVTLEIVERDKNRKEVTPWSFNMFSKRDIIPGRRAKKGAFIQMEDIIPALKRVAIYGSPGTGKTTLCKKIVYEFYKNRMWNDIFAEIILIQLRGLRKEIFVEIGTINDLVAQHLKCDSETVDFSNCLFILDGWDEISDLDRGTDSPHIIKLLKRIMSDHKVIMTSRPNANMTHIFRHADQVLEIQGFDEFNARKYIKNVLNSGIQDDEANFIDFLDSVTVSDMITIPIILDILLFTWEEIKTIRKQNSELTLTTLYEVMVLKLWNEFLPDDKRDKYQNLRDVIRADDGILYRESVALSKIARKCFEEGNLLFSWSYIESCDVDCMNALVKSRFLNAVNANQGNEGWKQYEFIHLTLCEFFTALNYVLYTGHNRI
ncbi:hypothetical protein HA402_005536 [Bradysia odoriphaga]|nr:hypothetical protein HA402_005536 [Bradysia odoriphaga]